MRNLILSILGIGVLLGGIANLGEAAPNITDGLIAAYEFNGNANDSSGNGNDATVYGATLASDRFGKSKSAYDFDGNDYIQTPVNSNTTPLSFSVWFNLDSVSGERSIVDSDVSSHYGHSLIIGYVSGDGDIDVQYHNSYIDTNFYVETGRWYHAVVNYSSTIQLYIDGKLIAEKAYGSVVYDGTNFRFGRHNSGDPQWFDGRVDDVYFFNRTLSEAEINLLYTYTPPPGDCDGSGDISIAEVQGAINMYLDLQSVAACVDTDGDDSVSIAEVQKVINGYLGL